MASLRENPGLKPLNFYLGLHVKSHDQLEGTKGIRLTQDVPSIV